MPLISNDFFYRLIGLLKTAPVSNTIKLQIAEILDETCPTFKKDDFLTAIDYVPPTARVLRLGAKRKVVPLHRSPETEDHSSIEDDIALGPGSDRE